MKKLIVILMLLLPVYVFAGNLDLDKQKLQTLEWKRATLVCRINQLQKAIQDIDKEMKTLQAIIKKAEEAAKPKKEPKNE